MPVPSISKHIEFEAYDTHIDESGIASMIEVSFSVVAWDEVADVHLWNISLDEPMTLDSLSAKDRKRLDAELLAAAEKTAHELDEDGGI